MSHYSDPFGRGMTAEDKARVSELLKESESSPVATSTVGEFMGEVKQKLEEKRASRHNTGKSKLSYIHLDCFEEAARVMEMGAQKYGRDNWRLGQDINQLLDSMLRHVAKLQSGEQLDQESGLSHIGHIQCNAMFLGLWLKKQHEKGE